MAQALTAGRSSEERCVNIGKVNYTKNFAQQPSLRLQICTSYDCVVLLIELISSRDHIFLRIWNKSRFRGVGCISFRCS